MCWLNMGQGKHTHTHVHAHTLKCMAAASAGVGYLCTSVFYFLVVSAACLPYADGTLLF